MKSKGKIALALAVVIFLLICVLAGWVFMNRNNGQLEYALNDDGQSYSVTGIDTSSYGKIIPFRIVIPSTYKDKPVTSIGDSAFWCCGGLTSITIPDSVTSIGYRAFFGCIGLTGITIGKGLTSIGDCAFRNCIRLRSIKVDANNPIYHSDNNCLIETATKTLILGCRNSKIPTDGSVTSIGESAFWNCPKLKSIKIPDSVTSIGKDAFYWCSGLTSITIGKGLTSIGEYAFAYCVKLKSITIPDSVTSIDRFAFEDCSGLTSITLLDSVESIGEEVFYECSELKSVTIGKGLTSISEYAFAYCIKLKSITISDSVTSIGKGAFKDCSELSRIDFSGSIEAWQGISKESNWDSLTDNYTVYCTDGELTKGGKVTYSTGEVEQTTGLRYDLNADGESYSVTYLGSATGIDIVIHSTYNDKPVTRIGDRAFYGCRGLSRIYFLGTVAEWQGISKGGGWDKNTGDYTVYCTDGEIKKNGTVTYY